MAEPLKLRGEDDDDLSVIATHLQDAIVRVGDMVFQTAERRFVAMFNRFRWENAGATSGAPAVDDAPFEDDSGQAAVLERVKTALRFEGVTAVRTRGIDRRRPGQVLSLLTMRAEESHVDLVFSGNAYVRLEVSSVRCIAEDVGESWPTFHRPEHPVDDPENTLG
jgi:hypothetical protein